MPLATPQVEGELVFNNVQLYYPSRPTVKVLDDFTATFPKGKITALVGTSGSGKSSVIGLLERFYSGFLGAFRLSGLPSNLICGLRSTRWHNLPRWPGHFNPQCTMASSSDRTGLTRTHLIRRNHLRQCRIRAYQYTVR